MEPQQFLDALVIERKAAPKLVWLLDKCQAENERLKKSINSSKQVRETQIICGAVTCTHRDEDSKPKGICSQTAIHLYPCAADADNVFVCSEWFEQAPKGKP